MKQIKSRDVIIVILDSGVSACFSEMIYDSYEIIRNREEKFEIINESGDDLLGHGSAIANIVHSIDDRIKLINFKICDFDNEVESQAITFALTYIYDNLDVNIINISAGVTYIEDYYEMKTICQKLHNKGVVIIAAFDNDGAVSYPAAFDTVIGIDSTYDSITSNTYSVSGSIVNLLFPPKYYRTYWNDGKKALLRGNSFACAHFSGLFGKYLLDGGNDNVHDYIHTFADRTITCKKSHDICGPPFSINRAIVFPVNKEAHAILRMKTELSFEIAGAYDDRLSGNVGKTFCGTLIENIDSLDWESSFDTVILSCVKDLERIVKKEYMQRIIDNCKKYSKQLYAFEDFSSMISHIEGASKYNDTLLSRFFFPSVNDNMVPYHKMNKLNRISVPVVGVLGTSSKQGKYTLQLHLLKLLKERKYSVGFLATEPSGYLFNADYTFHFGYHANTNLTQRGIIAILNDCLFNIQLNGADIIITGCQSATTHYDNSNISRFCIEQYSFLLGSTPDFAILCINSYDEKDYIERTLSCIQSVGSGRVMAIALLPKEVIHTVTGLAYSTKFLNNDEMYERKKYFSEVLSLPVYCIGNDEDMINLCDQIIDYFSEKEV